MKKVALPEGASDLYIVHMKRVTASEARQRWFALLDEVIGGEVVAIIRKGKRIILRREEAGRAARQKLPAYAQILRVPDVDRADSWGWDWHGPEQELALRDDFKP